MWEIFIGKGEKEVASLAYPAVFSAPYTGCLVVGKIGYGSLDAAFFDIGDEAFLRRVDAIEVDYLQFSAFVRLCSLWRPSLFLMGAGL